MIIERYGKDIKLNAADIQWICRADNYMITEENYGTRISQRTSR
jgi:hypothetical protein